ncbi:hypothetical protein BGZ65_006796, partial [Modicella reniformis]
MTNPDQTEHFSLRSWIRNTPWKHFKNGCRLIVKSPLHFLIFFLCLSVVVWGAFLVLLLANLVKFSDNAIRELWIEIASQVLNGLFTLANVPVHPKRFLGFIRGFSIWREDGAIRQQFVDRFLKDHIDQNTSAESSEKNLTEELLGMLDYYRCFPDYGRYRTKEQGNQGSGFHGTPSQSCGNTPSQPEILHQADTNIVIPGQPSQSLSRATPSRNTSRGIIGDSGSGNPVRTGTIIDVGQLSSSDGVPASENGILVDFAEDELNKLIAEETRRVVHSVVLPFLPFPLDISSNLDSPSLNEHQDLSASSKGTCSAPVSPRPG